MFTFSYIKPDGYAHRAKILKMIQDAGFLIAAQKEYQFTQEDAEFFYGQHSGRPFYDELIQHTISGPVVLLVIANMSDTVNEFRQFIGNTNAAEAEHNTIRWLFGVHKSCPQNAIHASDSNERAIDETKYFLPVLTAAGKPITVSFHYFFISCYETISLFHYLMERIYSYGSLCLY